MINLIALLFILIGLFGSDNRVKAGFYLFLYTFYLKCKRAKTRGSPKALVTKVIREILLPAWLITQGMVTSLVFICLILEYEKLHTVVDIWVIAVLNHFYYYAKCKQVVNNKDVKEQRVDGSSNSRNLDFVRCTLVAGKPVLNRKIHSHFNNNNFFRNTLFKRSIHTSKPTLNPWFVTGLVDAEGCFTLGFFKSDNYKMGYQIQAIFKITLHKKDFDLLSQIQYYFGAFRPGLLGLGNKVGSITKHGDTTLQYTVKSLKELDIIMDHFDKYPLLGLKWGDYKLFSEGILLLKNKIHLTKEGFEKILRIKAGINLGLSDELSLNFPQIKPVSKPLISYTDNIDPNWISGLACGDGCFHISIRNSTTTKLGKSVVLKFHIVQHCRDIELMRKLKHTLGCGRIELTLQQSAVYFVVTNFKDISDKIIPLFDQNPIKGVKALDYSDFKEVVNLMYKKDHLTEQGLSKIQSIRSNMNLFRK